MTKLQTIIAALLLAALPLAGTASAQTFPNQPPGQHIRNAAHSDQNLRRVRRRLEGLIDQLQRDQHDYSGHRVAALNDLRQARAEILAALQADAGH